MKERRSLVVRSAVGAFLAAAVLALAPSVARAEARIPRLELATDGGGSSVRFRLAVQLLYTYLYEDRGSSQPLEHEHAIAFRRIRPEMTGSIGTRDFTYRLHLNLVPGAIELIDLYFNYSFHQHFQLFFGQGKIPFTRYRIGSFKDRPVVDWSYPTRYFGAERQIGLMFHNGVDRPPEWEYQLGVYTGVNARASNGVGPARVFADPRPNPSDLTDPAAPSSFHPEVVLHLAYNFRGADFRAPQDWEGGPIRFTLGLSGAWDARPVARQDLALRLAPEAAIKVRGFSLWGVLYLGFWDEVTGDEAMQLGMLGGVLQASYVFLDRYEVGLRYANVTILSALRRDARAYADSRIEAAEGEAEREALIHRYRDTGLLEAEHELNLGFNVYLLSTALKLMIDAGLLIHEQTDGDRYDMQIRAQAQLAF